MRAADQSQPGGPRPTPKAIPAVGPQPLRRTVLIGSLVGVPISAVLLYLAVRRIQPGEVADTLSGARVPQVVLAALVIGGIYCVQAVRWHWIARRETDLRWPAFLGIVISSVAVNNVIPGRPGDILRGYWLGRAARIPQVRAFATVVVDRSCDVVVLVLLFVAVFPFVEHPAWLEHVFLGTIALGAIVVGFLALASRIHWRGRIVSGLMHGIGTLVDRRDGVGVVPLLLTGANWAGWSLAAWLVASSVGLEVSPLQALFLTAVINLGAAIPSSPGFVGTFQWLCVSGMALFGVANAPALAFSIIMQAIWYVPTTLVGLVLLTRAGWSVWSARALADVTPPV